jgi:hypothetical protein
MPGPTSGGDDGGGGGDDSGGSEPVPQSTTKRIQELQAVCEDNDGNWDTYRRGGRRYYECLQLNSPDPGQYSIEYYNAQGEGLGHCVGKMQGPVSEQCHWWAEPHP